MYKKKPFYKRVRWLNVALVAFCIFFIFKFFTSIATLKGYEISYEMHYMRENDSLFNVVQEKNQYYPAGWNAQDFVYLAIDKNEINDVSSIPVGHKVMIPIAHKKE
jgi:hypothetical protein